MSGSISSLPSEVAPGSGVKGLQKIYFQSQTVTLSEGSFGVFNILSDEKVSQNITINLSLSGPAGRFQPLPELIIFLPRALRQSQQVLRVFPWIFQSSIPLLFVRQIEFFI